MPTQVRMRTDEELDRRMDDMLRFRQVMDDVGLVWWLGGGSVLGAVRDQDFIRWDWDVEFHAKSEQAVKLFQPLVQGLMDAGFQFLSTTSVSKKHGWKLSGRRGGGDRIGILGWTLQDDGWRWRMRKMNHCGRKGLGIPDVFFQGHDTVTLRGVEWQTHSPADGYCAHAYGPDWQTPIQTRDKAEYMSPAFRGARS